MKAEKLKSGNYRVQVSRQGVRRSFTAFSKKEAERLAREWKEASSPAQQRTFREMSAQYIASRSNILSASTIATYEMYCKNYYDSINDFLIDRIDNKVLQNWLNEISPGRSGKYVDNIYSFITSVLAYGGVNNRFNVAKKPIEIPDLYLPKEEDIKRLLDRAKEYKDKSLYICLLLGAFCSMRRGEIFALTDKSFLSNGKILVAENVVINNKREYVRKGTKTNQSRTIQPPRFVLDEIKKYGLPTYNNPDAITDKFATLRKHLDLTEMRFHDLRHFCAAKMLSGDAKNNIPPIPFSVVQEYGGWRDRKTLERIYNYVIDEVRSQSMTNWDFVAENLK